MNRANPVPSPVTLHLLKVHAAALVRLLALSARPVPACFPPAGPDAPVVPAAAGITIPVAGGGSHPGRQDAGGTGPVAPRPAGCRSHGLAWTPRPRSGHRPAPVAGHRLMASTTHSI